MTIELNVSDKYVSTFLAFIKTLSYVEVNKVIEPAIENRLTADEIEDLIIKRAKANALKIESGEMPSRPISALLAELETE
jgi:Trp operon repressor